MAFDWLTCVFTKRPFFFKSKRTLKKSTAMPSRTTHIINKVMNVFNIFSTFASESPLFSIKNYGIGQIRCMICDTFMPERDYKDRG